MPSVISTAIKPKSIERVSNETIKTKSLNKLSEFESSGDLILEHKLMPTTTQIILGGAHKDGDHYKVGQIKEVSSTVGNSRRNSQDQVSKFEIDKKKHG